MIIELDLEYSERLKLAQYLDIVEANEEYNNIIQNDIYCKLSKKIDELLNRK